MSQIWAGLGVVAVLAVIAFGMVMFRRGAQNATGKAAEKGLKDAREARKVAEDVSRLDDGALDDELRHGPRR